MKLLTEDALILCDHVAGKASNLPGQSLVTIGGRRVLVEADPEGRAIAGCPNVGATIKPCTLTLKATAGYSAFIRVDGRRVCLDTLDGLTDGTPPGAIHYRVRLPGQDFVSGAA